MKAMKKPMQGARGGQGCRQRARHDVPYVSACLDICHSLSIYTHIYVYVYIYIHVYTHIHICIHISRTLTSECLQTDLCFCLSICVVFCLSVCEHLCPSLLQCPDQPLEASPGPVPPGCPVQVVPVPVHTLPPPVFPRGPTSPLSSAPSYPVSGPVPWCGRSRQHGPVSSPSPRSPSRRPLISRTWSWSWNFKKLKLNPFCFPSFLGLTPLLQ